MSELKIYHYHRLTGEMTFTSFARPDPLEPSRHLIPAQATQQEPPVAGVGEVAVFVEAEQGWRLVPDLRGRAYYDTATGARIVIQDIGQLADPAWTEQAPPDADHIWVNDGWLPSTGKLIPQVKQEAAARILTLLPEWQQRNATARAVEIVNARLDGQASAAELAELAEIQAIFAKVKAIRSASDFIEEDVTAGVVTNAAQIKGSGRWPVEG